MLRNRLKTYVKQLFEACLLIVAIEVNTTKVALPEIIQQLTTLGILRTLEHYMNFLLVLFLLIESNCILHLHKLLHCHLRYI